jgi:hypothetical protein
VTLRATAVATTPAAITVTPSIVVFAALLAHEPRALHVDAHGGGGTRKEATEHLADEGLSFSYSCPYSLSSATRWRLVAVVMVILVKTLDVLVASGRSGISFFCFSRRGWWA